MTLRRLSTLLFLLSAPVLAQTPAKPAAPAPTPPAPTPPVMTPAPMPDPLMSPDLPTLPGGPPSLAKLVQQSAWQDAVIAAARSQYKLLPDACGSAIFKPTGQLTLFAPTQFNDQNQLVAGIWTERVDVTGCGPTRLLNVLTVLQPGSPPSRIPTMPGDSHADPATQKNALQYAQAVAARAAPPGCKQQIFTNAAFDGYTGLPNAEVKDGRDSRAWREVWSISACGSIYQIGLTFTPNAQGTQLVATNPVKRN